MPLEAAFEAMQTIQGGQYPTVAVTISEAAVTAFAGAGALVLGRFEGRTMWLRSPMLFK